MQPVVAVRFCPVLFAAEPAPAAGAAGEARPAAAATAGRLPYRLVLAVATMDSIVRPAPTACYAGCRAGKAWRAVCTAPHPPARMPMHMQAAKCCQHIASMASACRHCERSCQVISLDSRGQQALGGAALNFVTALPEGSSSAWPLMRGGRSLRQALYDAAAGGLPLALMGALHPEPITDLAWSRDGRFLAVASYDGYCRRGRRCVQTLARPPAAAHRPAASPPRSLPGASAPAPCAAVRTQAHPTTMAAHE